MIHEKPYHNLNVNNKLLLIQVLHGCFQLMLWNCGFVRVINRNPCFICKIFNDYVNHSYYDKAVTSLCKDVLEGTKTSHHGLDIVGYRRATYS